MILFLSTIFLWIIYVNDLSFGPSVHSVTNFPLGYHWSTRLFEGIYRNISVDIQQMNPIKLLGKIMAIALINAGVATLELQ